MLAKALAVIPPTFTPMLIVGILLLRQIQSDERERYHCDTPEKIDEIRNIGQHLRRLVRYRDEVYFVLKNRIIYSKLITDSEGETQDGPFLSLDFFEKQQVESDSIDQVDDDYRVFGYVYERVQSSITQGSSVWELYILRDRRTASQTKSLIYNRTNRLEFSESRLAKRVELVTLDARIMDKLRSCSASSDIEYVNMAQVENGTAFTFMAQLPGQKNDSQTNDNRSFHATGRKTDASCRPASRSFPVNSNVNSNVNSTGPLLLLDFDWFGGASNKSHTLSNQPRWHHFTFYSKETGSHEQTLLWFIGIDGDFRVGLMRYDLILQSLTHYGAIVDFEDLLSCYTRFNKWRQIGGIYYDIGTRRFFLFIRRFFLQFDEDLVSGQFRLPANYDYVANAQKVPISFERFPISDKFSHGGTVKTLGDQVLYGYGREFYRLTITNNVLGFSTITNKTGASRCGAQTLLVEKRFVFCFDETTYSFLYEIGEETSPAVNRTPSQIKSIFNSTVQSWEESLRAIFNYENETVVFMTKYSLFVFEYTSFMLNPTDKSQICYNHSAKAPLQLRNYLYKNIEPHDNPIPKPSKNRISNYLILIAFILVALVSVLWIRRSRNALKSTFSRSTNLNSLEAIQKSVMPEETDASESSRLGKWILFKINKRVCSNIKSNFGSNLKSNFKSNFTSNFRKSIKNKRNSISKSSKTKSRTGQTPFKPVPLSVSTSSTLKKYSASKSVFMTDTVTLSARTSFSFDRKSCGSNAPKESLSHNLVSEVAGRPPQSNLQPKGSTGPKPRYKTFKL